MAVHTPLKVDHQVLGEDFCSGYMDPFGNWNTGFPCPRLDEETPGLCCGVDNLKYCCNGHGPRHIVNDVTHLPLVMGIIFGMSVAMIVSVVVCCFKCSCCLLYKKRQPANTGPLYHLHCSNSGSAGGVANMYSFSSDATPQDTPRSSTRSHRVGLNNRWSTATADSGPGLLSLDHHLALLEDASPATVHATFRPHNLSEDRLSNSGSGGRLPSSVGQLGRAIAGNNVVSLTEDEELPPPYNSNHSTLIAVRTNHTHQGQYTQPATSSETNNSTNNNSRISNITATNNHPASLTRTPPLTSLPSSSPNPNSLTQGFPSFLHQQQQQQQHSLGISEAPNPRPHFIQSRPQQRHSIASVASEDSFTHGFPSFPPPPAETTASTAATASNIFSLPAPPPPSRTLQQSLSLHHNNLQQHNNHISNWHHQRSSSLYNPCSTSSHCSNSSSGTFAPVLSPTRRPCSTAHIVHMHNQNPHLEQQHLYTATKF